jgi:hypothetical protein
MPLPERVTSDHPQPDAELLRFIDRRREREARRRRRLWLFGTAAAAGVIVLAVASYLVVGRATGPSATAPVATAPSSSPTPTPTAPPAEAPPAPPPAPRTDDAATSSPSRQPRAADVERAEPATPPPAREPQRPPARRLPPSDVPPTRWVEVQPAASDSVRRTATWLVQTHGRQEAEARAATVAEFYSGEQRAFWRRVLEEVRRTPER